MGKSPPSQTSPDVPKFIAAFVADPPLPVIKNGDRRQGKYLRIFASSCRGL